MIEGAEKNVPKKISVVMDDAVHRRFTNAKLDGGYKSLQALMIEATDALISSGAVSATAEFKPIPIAEKEFTQISAIQPRRKGVTSRECDALVLQVLSLYESGNRRAIGSLEYFLELASKAAHDEQAPATASRATGEAIDDSGSVERLRRETEGLERTSREARSPGGRKQGRKGATATPHGKRGERPVSGNQGRA